MTLPIATVSMSSGLRPARSTAARIATAPRSGAVTSFKVPPKAPIAVRTGSAITTERDVMARSSDVVNRFRLGGLPRGFGGAVPRGWRRIAKLRRQRTSRLVEASPIVAILKRGDRHHFALVEANQRSVDHVFRRHHSSGGQVRVVKAALFPDVRRGRGGQHGLNADAFAGEFVLQRLAEGKNVGFAPAV